MRSEIDLLNATYREKKSFLDQMADDLTVAQDNATWRDLGVYEPVFTYESSEIYKSAIRENVDQQKQMMREKTAVACSTVWRVNNSERDGRALTDQSIRFTLRAFNHECEVIISKVRWNNLVGCRRRIEKAFADINKLKKAERISISVAYFDLKIQQLQLAYEHAQQLQEEKEEARRTREIEREKLKVEKDLEEALRTTEMDQERYRVALSKAREEMGVYSDQNLSERIAELEGKLAAISEERERALSMAQLTRSGYVYIISNLGCFGDKVFKVGMTRRLDPMDRVRELGDASVPFTFDVHAIIWTRDAPSLEGELHRRLHAHRVNKVNFRKEFFRVEIDVVKKVVMECIPDASFSGHFEAEHFRASSSAVEIISPSLAE